MLLELREDRFYTHGWGAVISNDWDAIDEQEEQARAEVRLTGELFAFPTGEAFCDMVGYSPPVGPYRTPKGERVSPFRGDTRGRGVSNFKKTRNVPGGSLSWGDDKKRKKQRAKQRAKHPAHFEWADQETANRAEAVADAAAASRLKVKEANKRRWQRAVQEKEQAAAEALFEALCKGPIKFPVYCGTEPMEAPMYRMGDYDGIAPGEGEEFVVLWPGHPIHRRLLTCLSREQIMFASGEVKDAVVFDLDGCEMRIETSACWPTWKFHILGEKEP